jgi:hypothetical protein
MKITKRWLEKNEASEKMIEWWDDKKIKNPYELLGWLQSCLYSETNDSGRFNGEKFKWMIWLIRKAKLTNLVHVFSQEYGHIAYWMFVDGKYDEKGGCFFFDKYKEKIFRNIVFQWLRETGWMIKTICNKRWWKE